MVIYTNGMSKPTDEQLAALGTAFETFARRYKVADALRAEQPLNEIDKLTLFYVADHPDCGPSDVARFLGIPNTTLTSATDRLAKRKLLDRQRVEGDRRAVALRLSKDGQARFDALMSAHRVMYRRLLEPLSGSERNELIRLMTKIVHND